MKQFKCLLSFAAMHKNVASINKEDGIACYISHL